MKCQREDVLRNFLKSEKLKDKSTLTADELRNVKFSDETPDLLIEAVKKLIISYCNEDSDVLILRNINHVLAK